MTMSLTTIIPCVDGINNFTALWGILGVTARQECCFEAKFDFTIK